jgi:hypothetical protein
MKPLKNYYKYIVLILLLLFIVEILLNIHKIKLTALISVPQVNNTNIIQNHNILIKKLYPICLDKTKIILKSNLKETLILVEYIDIDLNSFECFDDFITKIYNNFSLAYENEILKAYKITNNFDHLRIINTSIEFTDYMENFKLTYHINTKAPQINLIEISNEYINNNDKINLIILIFLLIILFKFK